MIVQRRAHRTRTAPNLGALEVWVPNRLSVLRTVLFFPLFCPTVSKIPIPDIVRDANPGYHLPVVYSNRLMSWTTVFLTAIVFRPLPTNEIYSSGSAGFSFASSMWFRRDLALFTPFTFSM
jgi:hypothetical protein